MAKKRRKKLEGISNIYINKQFDIDKELVKFRYKTIQKYFKGDDCLEIGTAEGIMTRCLIKNLKSYFCRTI